MPKRFCPCTHWKQTSLLFMIKKKFGGSNPWEWDHDSDLTVPGLWHSQGDMVLPETTPNLLVGNADKVVLGVTQGPGSNRPLVYLPPPV